MGQWGAILPILTGITMIAVFADRDGTHEKGSFRTVMSALLAAAAYASPFAFGHAATELTNGLVSAIMIRVVAIGVVLSAILVLRLPLLPKRGVVGALDGTAIYSILAAAVLAIASKMTSSSRAAV